MSSSPTSRPVSIAVLTVSDSRTEADDVSGNTLVERIETAGHNVAEKAIVTDDRYKLREIISRWIADPKIEAVITTGGTGVTGRDVTPDALQPLFDNAIDGFGELFRWISYQSIKTSTMQSRSIAGVANGTYIFCLPGSPGACRDAWDEILQHQLNIEHKPCNLVELMPRLLER